MAIANILTDESDYLHNRTKDVVFPLSEEIKALIQDLKDTLLDTDTGAGLAAPQIGAPFSIFVYRTNEHPEPVVVINPSIIKAADYGKPEYEMCLSYPYQIYSVERAKRIAVRFYDEEGNHSNLKYRGHEAVIIQHETDHLLGLTIKDRGQLLDKKTTMQLLGIKDVDEEELELDLAEEEEDGEYGDEETED